MLAAVLWHVMKLEKKAREFKSKIGGKNGLIHMQSCIGRVLASLPVQRPAGARAATSKKATRWYNTM